ncbi:MAG: SRPBCC domain-containing protein [Burkholderiales bacterium]
MLERGLCSWSGRASAAPGRTPAVFTDAAVNGSFKSAEKPGLLKASFAEQVARPCRMTSDLLPVRCGSELSVTQAGIPEAIALEMCYLGWQESLVQLAALVEPDIPG